MNPDSSQDKILNTTDQAHLLNSRKPETEIYYASAKVFCRKFITANAYPDESNGPAKIIKKHWYFNMKYIYQVKCAIPIEGAL